MASSELELRPVALALHTRDRERDYHWYCSAGESVLADKLRELHRDLLADFNAKPDAPATFLLLEEHRRLGLIVANLKTSRTDHMNTRLYDTLLLEFDDKQRSAVYRLAAGLLLDPSSSAIQQRCLEYAEARFEQKDAPQLAPLSVPLPTQSGGSPYPLGHSHAALRANEANCGRLAAILEHAADNGDYLGSSVLIVCTGFAGKDRLQRFVPQAGRLIALSRLSSLPEEDEVDLTPAAAAEKKNRQRRQILAPAGVLVGGLFLVLILVGFGSNLSDSRPSSSTGSTESNNLNNGSSTSKEKSSDSKKKSSDSDKDKSATAPEKNSSDASKKD
jgi:hypothetical protein